MTTQSYQPQVNLTAVEPPAKEKWRLGGLVVLAVLGAFALVFIYYRWFGSVQPADESGATSKTVVEKPISHVPSRRNSARHESDTNARPASEAQLTLGTGVIQSAIRSPLAVEVISSNGKHQILDTRNDAVYLGLNEKTPAPSMVASANLGNGMAPLDSAAAKPQTMEGEVVLLATIDKDGNIQKLQPISGPEILFAAAREAVKGWRFKPYYAAGAAVDTETQITVKFAISAH